MSVPVRVIPSLLTDLESKLRRLPVDMNIAIQRDFSRCGPVSEAYASVADKWVKSRQEIDEGVTKIADIVRAIHDAFVGTDTELAKSLTAIRN
jgi:hypothetical protein